MTIHPNQTVANLLTDGIQDLVLITTSNGILVWVSPSCLKILGYAQEEMMNQSARLFLYPDDLDATREEMRASRKGKITANFECRYVHKDGYPVPLQWTGMWSDTVGLHLFVGRDVTAHRALLELDNIKSTLVSIDDHLRRYPPYRLRIRPIEIGLTMFSLWAALALFRPPSNFAAFPTSFSLAARLTEHEFLWGVFALVAAVMKIVGMALLHYDHRNAPWVRVVGLSMSGIFWSIMGISAVWGNSDTLFGASGVIFGPLALWSAFQVSR